MKPKTSITPHEHPKEPEICYIYIRDRNIFHLTPYAFKTPVMGLKSILSFSGKFVKGT